MIKTLLLHIFKSLHLRRSNSTFNFQLSTLFLFLLSSCSPAPEEWVAFEDYSGLDPNTAFIPYQAVTNTLTDDVIASCPQPAADDGQSRTTSFNAPALLKALYSFYYNRDIRSYCGTYYSVDEDGNRIKLSGRIIVPQKGKVKRAILVSHFTIGRNDEAPSLSLPLESVLATEGLAVIVPDYMGFGATADRTHPYLCLDITTRNVVDMYKAALPFLKHIGMQPENDDLLLLGYSQGGITTLAAQDYIQRTMPGTKVRYTMAGGGPYDIALTYDIIMGKEEYDVPFIIPMVIKGLNHGERLNLDMAQFFQEPTLSNFDYWIDSKKYYVAQISALMETKKISEILTPEAHAKTCEGIDTLYYAMRKNSLPPDYAPQSPVYIFHSTDDNIVPFENSDSLRARLTKSGVQNVIYDFDDFGNHDNAFLRFISSATRRMRERGDI